MDPASEAGRSECPCRVVLSSHQRSKCQVGALPLDWVRLLQNSTAARMIQAGRQTYCGEVTHCMPSRVSQSKLDALAGQACIACFGQVSCWCCSGGWPWPRGSGPCGGLDSVTIVPFGWCFRVVGHHGSKASPTSRCSSVNL